MVKPFIVFTFQGPVATAGANAIAVCTRPLPTGWFVYVHPIAYVVAVVTSLSLTHKAALLYLSTCGESAALAAGACLNTTPSTNIQPATVVVMFSVTAASAGCCNYDTETSTGDDWATPV